MKTLFEMILPELCHFPSHERAEALKRANRTPLEFVELLGIAAGLVVVTALTRYGAAGLSIADRIGLALLNFAIALPLLALVLAPFLIRRTRRGLRAELARRGAVHGGA